MATSRSLVQREKFLPVLRFTKGKPGKHRALRNCAVLEAPLGKYGHFEAGDGFDAAGYDIPLQLIEPVHIVVSELDKRNTFGYCYHSGLSERAETSEAEVMRRSVCSAV